MLKKLSFLVSMPFMAVLMIILIVVLALATFMESAYSTQTAWAVFYGTHWFEVLMLLIGINLVGVMVKQKFFRRKKIVVLLFHLSFILILVGASITRFISYEGNMHIRENQASNVMLSNNAYIDVVLEVNGETSTSSRKVMLTDLTPKDYRMSTNVGGEKVKIKSTEYLSSIVEQYIASPGGEPYMQVMLVTERQTSVGLPSGTTQEVNGMTIGFNLEDASAMINFYSQGETILMTAPFAGRRRRVCCRGICTNQGEYPVCPGEHADGSADLYALSQEADCKSTVRRDGFASRCSKAGNEIHGHDK